MKLVKTFGRGKATAMALIETLERRETVKYSTRRAGGAAHSRRGP